MYYNTFDAPCQASKSYIYRCAVSRGSSRILIIRTSSTDLQTSKTLNITMDTTHGLLFVGVWITVLFVICYILAVIDANRKKREEEKEKYKSSPLDVFWRNLK